MEDYRYLSELMERTIHKYYQMEKMKRHYGTEMLLTKAEIHTIAAIGNVPNINVTALAKFLGITKGASSQMVYKLVDKGMIEKKVSPNSDTEVCLTLTDEGKKAFESHRQYHATTNEHFFQIVRDLPKDVQESMVNVLEAFDHALDERLDKK